MRLFRALILLLCAVPMLVQAAALPAFSPRYGQAMAGVVQQKVAARGFAANDPRWAMTNNAIAGGLAGAATAAVGAATLPLWATIAAGAAVGIGVALATDAISNWLWNNDGTVTASGSTGNDPGNGGGSYYQAQAWYNGVGPYPSYGGDPMALIMQYLNTGYCVGGYMTNCTAEACTNVADGWGGTRSLRCYGYGYNSGGTKQQLTQVTAGYQQGTPPKVCGSGQFAVNGVCQNYAVPTTVPPFTGQAADAVAKVPDGDMVKPVNPKIIADSANAAWKAASLQPGYQGVPFDASNPITQADVQAWQAANPAAYPTVGDYLSPSINPATNTVPYAPPGAVTTPSGEISPGTNSAPQGSTKVDLGPDPAIGTPNLEATPSGTLIMKPITDGMAPWSNFAVPSHTSTCPTASFSWWNRTHTMDAHCTLIANNQSTITGAMYAFWVVVALFILLGA